MPNNKLEEERKEKIDWIFDNHLHDWKQFNSTKEEIVLSIKLFFRKEVQDFFSQTMKKVRRGLIQEVYDIMGDTLSVDTVKSHREVQEMYNKLLKLEKDK